jgi:acetyltransferase-like isoleucine patch superfamily enzyme
MTAEARIASTASIGANVEVGPFSYVHEGVIVGKGTVIGSHCEIGIPNAKAQSPLYIGPNSLIRSHTVIYNGSTFKDRLETGHFVAIRELTQAGSNFRVGSYGDIQGHCDFGDFVRLHSRVHIAQGATVGDLVWMSPGVQLTNDPLPPSTILLPTVIEDMTTIATNALIMPGITVGFASFVSAGSVVRSQLHPLSWVRGDPAERVASTKRLVNIENGLRFPFGGGFIERYPEDAQELIARNLRRFEESHSGG